MKLNIIWIERVVLGVLLVVMVGLSFDFGITWDEWALTDYGKSVWNFYLSGFTDLSSHHKGAASYYGGLFEVACIFFNKVFSFIEWYDARHIVNSLFGWLGILYSALLARRLFGGAAGIIVIVCLVLSPRFLGHSMNNAKDLPLATFHIMALYYMSFLIRHFPYARVSTAFKIIAAISLSINIRVGGLILIAYAAGFLSYLVYRDKQTRDLRQLRSIALVFLACTGVTIIMGTIFCPWSLYYPVVRPIIALMELTHFPGGVWAAHVLYRGDWLPIQQLPWHYLITWLCITTPVGILVAGLMAPFALRKNVEFHKVIGLVIFIAFPIFFIILKGSTLYDGARHLLFIYPPFVVLASGTFVEVWRRTHNFLKLRYLYLIILAVLLYHPLKFNFKNYPNQIVYFNQLTGGVEGAYKRYDLDYWGNSFKQAIRWIRLNPVNKNKATKVSAPIAPHIILPYTERYDDLEFAPKQADADYIILLLRGSRPVLESFVKKGRTAYTIEANGVPLCIVKYGASKKRL